MRRIRYPLTIIDGGGEQSKRRRRRARLVCPDDPETTDWHCPRCLKEDGERHNEVAVTYRGALMNAKHLTLKGAKKGPYLICTRCYRKGRDGMDGKRGAVALWEPGLGWQWLYINNR